MTCSLVTGATRGIGAAVAHALAEVGHRVAVHAGRDVEAATRVMTALPGSGHTVVSGDVSSPEACMQIVAQVVDELGDLDVLVNNAGVFEAHPIDATTYSEWQQAWRRTLAVNLVGPANLAWLAVDHLLHRPRGPHGGRLISVGSRGASRGEPLTPAYGASKAALHAMTQSLAVALAPHRHHRNRRRTGLRQHEDGQLRAGRASRRRHPRPEPLSPGCRAARSRRDRRLAGDRCAGVGQRHGHRRQWSVPPALNASRPTGDRSPTARTSGSPIAGVVTSPFVTTPILTGLLFDTVVGPHGHRVTDKARGSQNPVSYWPRRRIAGYPPPEKTGHDVHAATSRA